MVIAVRAHCNPLDIYIYIQKDSRIICLHSPTDCFMKISHQSTGRCMVLIHFPALRINII